MLALQRQPEVGEQFVERPAEVFEFVPAGRYFEKGAVGGGATNGPGGRRHLGDWGQRPPAQQSAPKGGGQPDDRRDAGHRQHQMTEFGGDRGVGHGDGQHNAVAVIGPVVRQVDGPRHLAAGEVTQQRPRSGRGPVAERFGRKAAGPDASGQHPPAQTRRRLGPLTGLFQVRGAVEEFPVQVVDRPAELIRGGVVAHRDVPFQRFPFHIARMNLDGGGQRL